MAAQGWAPGSLLGAKNAPHAQFHTEANASHIRVAIKDDTLGLGAKKGSGVGEGECVGLDAFKDILGRLNGKDDGVIMKEREEKEDLKRRLYVDGKYGGMKFVRGGVLVGDKIQDLIDGEKERVRLKEKKEKKEKKAKEERDESEKSAKDGASPDVVAVKTKKSKKRKVDQDAASEEDSSSESKKAKKERKEKKKEKKRKAQEAEEEAAVSPEDDESLRKKEKRERKEKRREEKRRKQEESGESEKTSKKEKKSKKRKEKEEAEKSSSEDEPSSTKPSASLPTSGTSTPVPAPSFGRHASVRSRFIAQKRAAIMDTASLNQVCLGLRRLARAMANNIADLHDKVIDSELNSDIDSVQKIPNVIDSAPLSTFCPMLKDGPGIHGISVINSSRMVSCKPCNSSRLIPNIPQKISINRIENKRFPRKTAARYPNSQISTVPPLLSIHHPTQMNNFATLIKLPIELPQPPPPPSGPS